MKKENNKEQKLTYYERNRFERSNYTLKHAEKVIIEIRKTHAAVVDSYYEKYPFEEYESYVICVMNYKGIFYNRREYSDCFSVSAIAYMYSISQCAYRGYDGKHVKAYIKKLIPIYINCQLVIYDDERNLCQTNNFKQINIDDENWIGRI